MPFDPETGRRVYPDKLTYQTAMSTPYVCKLSHVTLPYVTHLRTPYGTVCVVRSCRICHRDRIEANHRGLSIATYRTEFAAGRIDLSRQICDECGGTGILDGFPCYCLRDGERRRRVKLAGVEA